MLEKKLRKLGQDHIVNLLNSENGRLLRERISRDLDGVDIDLVGRLIRGEDLYEPPRGDLIPAEVIPAAFASSDDALVYIRRGQELLQSGKVAALVVAGGQGSRLGIDAPKGVVGVTPVKGKSLFYLFAEKILALKRKFRCSIPWFIMTSRENDGPTRDYFRDNGYFGLDKGEVHFFIQGMLPSITPEGKFIISENGGLFMNPDGHGGTFRALLASGALSLMEGLGIDEIFYFQVDNPLVKICDPLFLGLHNLSGAQMSSKVVRKSGYDEKVGVIARLNGKTALVEYSDLDDALRYASGPDGGMLYWAGSIAVHIIGRRFAEEISANNTGLPFHRARKAITARGPDGMPLELEGIKFETFLFDALPLADRSITLEVLREEEFSPIKNLTGVDSLESSRRLQSALHASWLQRLGVDVGQGVAVEISPLYALDFKALELKALSLPKQITKDTYLG
ncbi:MAG TPA: UTP--glucose-1-phosphate uridylyltransferase [Desulfomonilia bacterium]|nr:UTP--glucose-1-phosphate uridylyltransferase [Desulfomonilia bacterium]